MEAAALAVLILLALVAIGALFYVFLAADNRADFDRGGDARHE
jgi:hypothetical protein